jgi:hypothetical protein
MVVVAIIAVALGGVETLRRRRAFALKMAARHRNLFFNAMNSLEAMKDFRPIAPYADYHLDLEFKWVEAARVPWLPFKPDPPEPNWDFGRAVDDEPEPNLGRSAR